LENTQQLVMAQIVTALSVGTKIYHHFSTFVKSLDYIIDALNIWKIIFVTWFVVHEINLSSSIFFLLITDVIYTSLFLWMKTGIG
jgi:hypothetical protein